MAEYPFTDEGLRQALRALGGYRDHVAATLRRMGIKGTPCVAGQCAIAVYVERLFGGYVTVGPADVGVTRTISAVEFGEMWTEYERIEANLPAPVASFVRAYDLAQYPDLIKEAA